VIAVSINTYIVSLGFGQHMATISYDNLKTINLNTIIVAAFGIFATSTGKTSFALTLYRITSSRWMKAFLIFVVITVCLPQPRNTWIAAADQYPDVAAWTRSLMLFADQHLNESRVDIRPC
jgi:hypothetical protein